MIPGIPLRGCAPAAGGERKRTPWERGECVKDDYPIRFSNDNPLQTGGGCSPSLSPTPDRIGRCTMGNPEKNVMEKRQDSRHPAQGVRPGGRGCSLHHPNFFIASLSISIHAVGVGCRWGPEFSQPVP